MSKNNSQLRPFLQGKAASISVWGQQGRILRCSTMSAYPPIAAVNADMVDFGSAPKTIKLIAQ
jgi:hypothetical protein